MNTPFTLLFASLAMIACQVHAQPPTADCPCTIRYEVTTAGPAPQTVSFENPFVLMPVCTAAISNRPGVPLQIVSASRTAATVALSAAGAGPFVVGDVIEVSCVLSNRRH